MFTPGASSAFQEAAMTLVEQLEEAIEAMNRLGYDAMALGPANLAVGVETLRARMA